MSLEGGIDMRNRSGYDHVKRVLDVVCATLGLIVGAPVLLLTGVLVRLTMGSPVFFTQERPGLNGKPFRILKFRTMRNATDAEGNPLPDEARLTRLGNFLRASSLDELPELWNVLRGEMSCVGPRPLLMAYLERYTSEQNRRHEVRPGITGWAQVNGRNAISWEQKFEYDVWYVDNCSLQLDVKIVLLTIISVVRRDGISSEGHVTAPEFNPQARSGVTGDGTTGGAANA
jgi:sugar transferase EpsL